MAGNADGAIVSHLLTGPLPSMEFEALSYAWGTTLLPYKIQMDGKPFYISQNLHSALKELRKPGLDRLLWIDAMTINQSDNAERSIQVQMMRDIFAKASQVIVWLGEDTKDTAPTFDFIRKFSNTQTHEAQEILWTEKTSSSEWRRNRRELDRILAHEWWTRAWIVQEVVVGYGVVFQRGSHQVAWDAFNKLLTYPVFKEGCGNLNAPYFARHIQDIRSEATANEPISNTLLGLAFRFRLQSATFGSNKIYALLGLLPENDPALVTPDYSKTPDDVFLQFTASCLENNKTLSAIALAAGVGIPGVSWCRDWRVNHDGSFPVTSFSALWAVNDYNAPHKTFSALEDHAPVFKADLTHRVLQLQGYSVDTIVSFGAFYQQINQNLDWHWVFKTWEQVAGGPWNDDDADEPKKSFNRTISAGCWSKEPLDWRLRIPPENKLPQSDDDKAFKLLVGEACINRRFFVTKSGRFGLGPWNMRKGDDVCVLFGGTAPFVLRECGKLQGGKGVTHKVVVEAYLDGCMHYAGSMENDIKSGKVVPKCYHLK